MANPAGPPHCVNTMSNREKDDEIARVRTRPRSLEVERAELESKLAELKRQPHLFARSGKSELTALLHQIIPTVPAVDSFVI